MSRPGIEPGPPAWEVSTLEKEPSRQLICCLFGTLLVHHNILHIKASKKFFTCLLSILSAKFGTSSKKAEECFDYGLDKEFLLLKYLSSDQCRNSSGKWLKIGMPGCTSSNQFSNLIFFLLNRLKKSL